MAFWLWAGFIVVIASLLALDLGAVPRRARPVPVPEAAAWTTTWVILGLAFNVGVFLLYERHVLGIGRDIGHELTGEQAALEFFSAYVIVKSLSIDNIFAIAVIFAYWRVAAAHQHRVLFWGILGALVMRGIMIAAGVALIERVSWITYVFGGLLLVTAAKMLLAHHYPIPTPVSLGVISGILTAGVLASVLAGHRDRTPLLSPLADELENLAEYSWKQVRRIVVLLAGATLLLTGLAMIVLPGPAILFIPAGLAILASEFLWARKLLAKMRQAGSSVLLRHDKGNRKDEAAKKR